MSSRTSSSSSISSSTSSSSSSSSSSSASSKSHFTHSKHQKRSSISHSHSHTYSHSHTHSHRRSHSHSHAPSSTTSSNSNSSNSSTVITRIDPTQYQPQMYATHLFIMRLIPSKSAPFPTAHAHDQAGKITASSTPQWAWSLPQCRAWVEQVLVKREGLGRKEARRLASAVPAGCDGKGLYVLSEEDWEDICCLGMDVDGNDDDDDGERRDGDRAYAIARKLFGMLKRRRGEEGAVPLGVRKLNGW